MTGERPGWLRQADTDAQRVVEIYDTWATGYNDDLASWGYEAPSLVARSLVEAVGVHESRAPILDVGCGTGLVGLALAKLGFSEIVGLDVSRASLERAATTGAYRDLVLANLQRHRIPSAPDSFTGLACVGVMTYLPNTEMLVSEFCRVVSSGGHIIFTQRQDLFVERDDRSTLERLESQGVCAIESISDPLPYLPGNAELAELPVVVVHLCSGRELG